jgi:hypothetical protein
MELGKICARCKATKQGQCGPCENSSCWVEKEAVCYSCNWFFKDDFFKEKPEKRDTCRLLDIERKTDSKSSCPSYREMIPYRSCGNCQYGFDKDGSLRKCGVMNILVYSREPGCEFHKYETRDKERKELGEYDKPSVWSTKRYEWQSRD